MRQCIIINSAPIPFYKSWNQKQQDVYKRQPNPKVDLHELIRYGKEKNVGIVLWLTWLTVENNFDLFKTCLLYTSLLNTYQESGFFPEWASPGHRGCMVGNNSASVVADAFMKNVTCLLYTSRCV